jgi:hypothetical protein
MAIDMNKFTAVSKKLFFKVFVICGVLWLALTIIFLWGELSHFDFGSKVNHEKVASYFTCLGFIVGICSIVGLFLQVSKSENDKHDTYKPLLMPKQAVISTTSQFGLKSPAKPPFVSVSGNHSTCFVILNGGVPIKNVGMGLAKRTRFYWEYDNDDLLGFVKSRSENMENLNEKAELEEVWRYLSRPTRQGKIEMEVQVIDKEELIQIFPPFNYILSLLNPYEYTSVSRFSTQPPKLTLIAKYQGIFDREFEQRFNTRIVHKMDWDDSGKANEVYQMDFELI